jgi:DNA polymerase-1
MRETLYLIDTYAQIFRAYFAIRGGMRSNVTGEPTHAVYGVAGVLIKLFGQFAPHYVAAAIDSPGKTFRDEMYGEYKSTRNATPDDLIVQIPRVFEVIKNFGVPLVASPGFEADDVIATIVRTILATPEYDHVDIRIVSKDKDLEQLLGDRVTMFDIQTETTTDVASLWENKGVTPAQVIDLLALTGDTSDNVPGVPGIGPKTAAQLVQQFGSIDGIVANLDQITGKKRESLAASLDALNLSRVLVTLRGDAPIDFTMDTARVSPVNVPELTPLFEQLGFRRYQEDIRRLAQTRAIETADPPMPSSPAYSDSLFADDDAYGRVVERPKITGTYRTVTTREQLLEVIDEIKSASLLSVDTETTGLGNDAKLCGISLAWKEGEGIYVPVRSPDPTSHLSEADVLAILGPILSDYSVPKCGHNIKFDASVFGRAGVKLRGIAFDSMLASSLMDPGRAAHKLDNLASDTLGIQMIPITSLIGDGPEQGTMDLVSLADITDYAAEDADVALRLADVMTPRLKSMGMYDLVRDVEAPLTAVLADMELNGICCDSEELVKLGDELSLRVADLRKQIYHLSGREFTIDSPKQLADILFDKLGLAAGKKTKTGRSTDIEVLEKLALQEDVNDLRTSVPRLVIEYRQLTKLIGTYLGNLRASIRPGTGRIHSTFHQLVTATGRLASQNPNLQNIPVRTELGRQIRKAFVAPPGHELICADYSQVELRLLAHLSGDEGLKEAFDNGLDIHTAVAAQVWGVPTSSVTREMRSQAKTINFGIIYGVTPYGLSRRIQGMSVQEASALISDYKRRFPGIDAFLQACVDQATSTGYVTTIMGRRRAIPEITSSSPTMRAQGERFAINTVVQGSAADLIKVAMVKVHRRIETDGLPLKLLLQIHDELVLESPADDANKLGRLVCEEMGSAMKLNVPLVAEYGAGPNWMDAK